eukprot:4758760-Pyramimonas_sp.AAC.1
MKGFASDMVTVLGFLFWFCTRYLLPEGKLVEQCRAISLAHEIIALLRTGDAAVRRTIELKSLVARYHRLLRDLYSTSILKIKAHLQHHLPTCLETV